MQASNFQVKSDKLDTQTCQIHRIFSENTSEISSNTVTQTCQIHRILLWEHEWDQTLLHKPVRYTEYISENTSEISSNTVTQTCQIHRIHLWEHEWDQLKHCYTNLSDTQNTSLRTRVRSAQTLLHKPVRYTEYFSENTSEISSNTVTQPVRYTEYFSENTSEISSNTVTQTCQIHRIHLWEHEWDQLKHCYTNLSDTQNTSLRTRVRSAQTLLHKPVRYTEYISENTSEISSNTVTQTCQIHRILLWEHEWDQLKHCYTNLSDTQNTSLRTRERAQLKHCYTNLSDTHIISENTSEISSNTVTQTCQIHRILLWEHEWDQLKHCYTNLSDTQNTSLRTRVRSAQTLLHKPVRYTEYFSENTSEISSNTVTQTCQIHRILLWEHERDQLKHCYTDLSDTQTLLWEHEWDQLKHCYTNLSDTQNTSLRTRVRSAQTLLHKPVRYTEYVSENTSEISSNTVTQTCQIHRIHLWEHEWHQLKHCYTNLSDTQNTSLRTRVRSAQTLLHKPVRYTEYISENTCEISSNTVTQTCQIHRILLWEHEWDQTLLHKPVRYTEYISENTCEISSNTVTQTCQIHRIHLWEHEWDQTLLHKPVRYTEYFSENSEISSNTVTQTCQIHRTLLWEHEWDQLKHCYTNLSDTQNTSLRTRVTSAQTLLHRPVRYTEYISENTSEISSNTVTQTCQIHRIHLWEHERDQLKHCYTNLSDTQNTSLRTRVRSAQTLLHKPVRYTEYISENTSEISSNTVTQTCQIHRIHLWEHERDQLKHCYTNLSDTQNTSLRTRVRSAQTLLHKPVRYTEYISENTCEISSNTVTQTCQIHRIHLWEHEWDQLKHCYTNLSDTQNTSLRTRVRSNTVTQTCQIHRILLWEHEWDQLKHCHTNLSDTQNTSLRTRVRSAQTLLHKPVRYTEYSLRTRVRSAQTLLHKPVRYTEYFSENTSEISSNTVTQTCQIHRILLWEHEWDQLKHCYTNLSD